MKYELYESGIMQTRSKLAVYYLTFVPHDLGLACFL